MTFPCTKCGLCCKSVGKWLEHKEDAAHPAIKFAMDNFPYATDETGQCEMLIDGSCSVYEDRPLLCDSDLMAVFMGIPTNKLYKLNAIMCNYMIGAAGLPATYLIDESQFD